MIPANAHAWIRDEDREFFQRELATFVPDRVFDAHCHLWKRAHVDVPEVRPAPAGIPEDVGYEQYCTLIDCLHPGRRRASVFVPFPFRKETRAEANEWVARQASKDPACRGLFFVAPDDDPEWVRRRVRELGLRGLKPYHMMSRVQPTWQADIPDYLPEGLVKVADEEQWIILLHMVKSRAVADPGNIDWIRHYCRNYPRMKLILAHAARGFQPSHNLEGLPQLADLDNLYFDTCVNCEDVAHESIIRIFGHRKLLWGSDFCVSHLRGRNFAAGDSFIWVCDDAPIWGDIHTTVKPVLLGLETLRSLKWACWSAALTDSQVEDIFWNNAARLFAPN